MRSKDFAFVIIDTIVIIRLAVCEIWRARAARNRVVLLYNAVGATSFGYVSILMVAVVGGPRRDARW